MDVKLFYLADARFGGWVTYTVHLYRALRQAGHRVGLFKIGSREETKSRPFGQGVMYRNVDLDAALSMPGKSLIVAATPAYIKTAIAILDRGGQIVVHDPAELKPDVCDAIAGRKVVIIRESNVENLASVGAIPVLIPHPYVSIFDKLPSSERPNRAVAFSRIDWDKNTHLIAEANAQLPPESQVEIWGAENSMYSHHKIDSKFPKWRERYRGRFAPDFGEGARIASTADFAVDLSTIAKDGGGTQYTFLEAWDAGAVQILHSKWRIGDRMDDVALFVTDAQELAALLEAGIPQKKRKAFVSRGRELVASHSAERVTKMYESVLS